MTPRWMAAVALLALAAACSGSGSKGLSVSTRFASVAAAPASSGLTLANGVTVERIRMVVRRVSVEGADATCDPSASAMTPASSATSTASASTTTATTTSTTTPNEASPADDGSAESGDCENELSFGPFYVEVSGDALTGAVTQVIDAPVPPGTYEEVAVQLNTIPLDKAGSDAGLRAMAEAHASILVEGVLDASTANERTFSFATPMAVEQEREGTIVIGSDPATNVTLDFDPRGWFTASDGTRLDPNDPTSQGQILENIRASLRLVRDDDANGCDDERDQTCRADG